MSTKRVYGYITTSDHKIREFEHLLHYYGIGVVKLDDTVDKNAFLNSGTSTYKVLGIVSEQTYLYNAGTSTLSTLEHASFVDHVSIVNLRIKTEDGYSVKAYEHTTAGIIDLTKKNPNIPSKYNWDDIFVILKCHMSYWQLSPYTNKISSRDKNLSQLITDYIHYKKRIDLHFNPQEYTDTIDFSRTLSDYVLTVPQFNTDLIKKTNLRNIIVNAINQGTFLRSAKTRREKVYWVPGLNAGIPLVPKSKDAMHEVTYQFHDFCHFNIPDLVYNGYSREYSDKLIKKVYIAYRLMSEAFTLPLGDMIFVKMLKDSGNVYETVNQRRIFPIYEQICRGRSPEEIYSIDFIEKILKGSFRYCFYGDLSVWNGMIGIAPTVPTTPDSGDGVDGDSVAKGGSADKKESNGSVDTFKHFQDKYDRYILEDFNWTGHNYNDMSKKPHIYEMWFDKVKEWRSTGDIELESVSEFIERGSLDRIDDSEVLLETIFKMVFNNIKRVLTTDVQEISKEDQLRNSFIRYMMGQSIIFFKFCFFKSSMQYFNFIDRTLKTQKIDLALINNLRAFYEKFLLELEDANLLTSDDVINYKNICPIFDTTIVDYDHGDKDIVLQEYVKQILG